MIKNEYDKVYKEKELNIKRKAFVGMTYGVGIAVIPELLNTYQVYIYIYIYIILRGQGQYTVQK